MSTDPRPTLHAVLYTRRDCPLCDELKEQLDRAPTLGLALRLVDIDADAALRDEFGWRVPVLEIEGRVTLEGRCEPGQLERRVARLRAELGTGAG